MTQVKLNEKQITKLLEVKKQFANLNDDEVAYAMDKILSCVSIISDVNIIDYAMNHHNKDSILGYEYIFDDFDEVVENTWAGPGDKSFIDSVWSLHKEKSIVLLLDSEGCGVQMQLTDSAPTHCLISLAGASNEILELLKNK